MPTPRSAYVLLRGDFLVKGEKVERAVPSLFPPLPEPAAYDREGRKFGRGSAKNLARKSALALLFLALDLAIVRAAAFVAVALKGFAITRGGQHFLPG